MYKWLLLLPFLIINSLALEISIDSAKDNFQKYSTLSINDDTPFLCQNIKNNFDTTTEIICAFSKRPFQVINKVQNDFFKVNTFIKKDTFFISIKPFYKLQLIPQVFDLTEDDSVYQANVELSTKWVIVGYKKKLPLINSYTKQEVSINFPFFMQKDELPYIGSLDIKGNPVFIKQVQDVKEYLRLKKAFKNKKYDLSMDIVDDVLDKYPNTLFKPELIYYKIRIYAKLKDFDNVVSYSKEFLREYSSSENIAEILSLIAKSYSEIGMYTDADYFFDRLFSEHENSVYAKWGYIYKGEMQEASGGTTQAIKFYKKALYSTRNLEVAATAAFRLANLILETSAKKATKYVDQIIKAKPSYFAEHMKDSMLMMHQFEDSNEYKTAADIASALLASINPTYDEYEDLLHFKALWLAKTDNKKQALSALNAYLKQFPDGDYIDPVQLAKDKLFFDTNDLNNTEKLIEYSKLIVEYPGDSIGDRALYEKAKILLNEKHFSEVLKMKNILIKLDEEIYPDIQNIISNAAIGVMQNSLKKKKCEQVITISNDYNITLSNKWDDSVYECAMRVGDFQLSKQIAKKNLKSDNLELRKKWLYRYIKVDFATGNYSETIEASKDLISLIENEKRSKYNDVYRYIFDTYERLEKNEQMISAMEQIEKIFGLDYKDIDRYVAMISIGSKLNDDNIVIKYAKKVMKIQTDSSSYAQSPYVEFSLYQAYTDKENFIDALKVIKSLDNVKLNNKDRARQKYLLGTVLGKLWRDEEAQAAYDAAIKADPKSAWAKLAKTAKDI